MDISLHDRLMNNVCAVLRKYDVEYKEDAVSKALNDWWVQ